MSRTTPSQVLTSDGLIRLVRDRFKTLNDHRSEPMIALVDALMCGFGIFFLKMPSLLCFEQERQGNAFNLRAWFGLEQIPCDTQLREILDPVHPLALRPAFTDIFRQLQRAKALEPFVFFRGHYLLLSDGTEYFNSTKVHCEQCLRKQVRNGTVTYYHQMLGMVLAHPDLREVIPLCPEPIRQQDGVSKGDGERSATRRALEHFRREHPHLAVILVEDALSAEGPHLKDLQKWNCRFILGVKPGKQSHLFDQMEKAYAAGTVQVLTLEDADGTLHHYRWLLDAELNKTHARIHVTMLEYWEIPSRHKEMRHFSWITDLEVNDTTVQEIVRGGRCRWKIENETFNTLKNQNYHFEHNFGHGKQHLSTVFATLMMLAFLVDQVLQRCDTVFQQALAHCQRKSYFWERRREFYRCFLFASVGELHQALIGFQPQPFRADTS